MPSMRGVTRISVAYGSDDTNGTAMVRAAISCRRSARRSSRVIAPSSISMLLNENCGGGPVASGPARGPPGPGRCSGRRAPRASSMRGRVSLTASNTGARCQSDAAETSATSSSRANNGRCAVLSAITRLRRRGAARRDRTRPIPRWSCDRAPRSAASRAARAQSAEPRPDASTRSARTTPTATANRTSQRRGGTSLNSTEDSADMENAVQRADPFRARAPKVDSRPAAPRPETLDVDFSVRAARVRPSWRNHEAHP